MRKERARWLKRAKPDFAGLAKAVDSRVVDAADPLATKLADLRSAIGTKIFGAVDKADANVKTLTRKRYDEIVDDIDDIEAAAYSDAIYDDALALLETAFGDVRDLLSLSTSTFSTPPTWALDALRDHADEVAQSLIERDRASLISVLDNALATGLSARDTAVALKATFTAGITSYDEHGAEVKTVPPPTWFTMVARTELQRASNLGQYSLYEAAGIAKVRWQAAEPCDECAEADDQVVDLGDDFPGVDVAMPPAHPNCRCVLVPMDDDLGDHRGTEEDRANARRGNQPVSSDGD